MTDASVAELVDPRFWRMPLEDRMARFADLREIGPFLPASFENPMTGLTEAFWVTTRYAEVVEISRHSWRTEEPKLPQYAFLLRSVSPSKQN